MITKKQEAICAELNEAIKCINTNDDRDGYKCSNIGKKIKALKLADNVTRQAFTEILRPSNNKDFLTLCDNVTYLLVSKSKKIRLCDTFSNIFLALEHIEKSKQLYTDM